MGCAVSTDANGLPTGTPSHGNPASSNRLNTELNNVARNTNNCDGARALVAAGADLSSTNGPSWRHTPLHQACYHGRYEMAKCLVELGAPLQLHSNPCGRGSHGTPLELARGGGHKKIVKMLEEALAVSPSVAKALKESLPAPPTSNLKPYTGPSRRLVLVNKGDRDQCVFSHASNLSRGEDVDLTLSSHPGLVIGRQYGDEKRHGPWRYIEAGIKRNVQPVRARYIDRNYIKLTDADLVFDVSFWKMETGNTVNFVGGTNRKDKTKLGGGGRDWVINSDGTISPKHQRHLALGVQSRERAPMILVRKGDPGMLTFKNASRLRNGETVNLSLSSHYGMGVSRMYNEEKRFGPWRYTESCVSSNTPISVSYTSNNYIKLADADLVFDVSFWKMEPGNTVNFVGGTNAKEKTMLGGGGRDWIIDDDGSISPKRHSHLSLGCCLESSPEPEIAVVQLPPPTAPPIAVAVALPLEGGGEGEATRCDKCNGCITREMKFCPECGMRNTKI